MAEDVVNFGVSRMVKLQLTDFIPITIHCLFDFLFQFHHLEVIFKLLQFFYVLGVFDNFSFLFNADILDPFVQGLPEYGFTVHQVLFLAEYVQIGPIELNSLTHGF